MRRPACTARNRAPGRRLSDTAHPPLRADRANAPAEAKGHPPRQANVRRLRPGGLGAKKPPRWSAERRASPGARIAKADPRGDARARVMGPLLTGAAAPERLSALRPLTL